MYVDELVDNYAKSHKMLKILKIPKKSDAVEKETASEKKKTIRG